MKSIKSLPENEEFYTRYAPLINGAKPVSWLGQVLSGITEFAAFFFMIAAAFYGFGQTVILVFAVIGSTVGVLVLEISKRFFVPYGVRQIVYRRFDGAERFISILLICAGAVSLCMSSVVSWVGSKYAVEAIYPEAEQKDKSAIDSLTSAEQAQINDQWTADSASIAARYTPQLSAITKAARSAYSAKNRELSALESRERKTGQNYSSKKSAIKIELSEINADRDAKLAAIEQQKGAELAALQLTRSNAIAAIQARQGREWEAIDQFNGASMKKKDKAVASYGGGLAVFCVVADALLLILCIISEIHKKKSGITEKIVFHAYDHAPGLWDEFNEVIAERFNSWARRKIRGISARTQDPVIPETAKQIIDYSGIGNTRLNLRVEDGGERQEMVIRAKQVQQGLPLDNRPPEITIAPIGTQPSKNGHANGSF